MKNNQKDDPNKLKQEDYNTNQMMLTARTLLKSAIKCNEPSFIELG